MKRKIYDVVVLFLFTLYLAYQFMLDVEKHGVLSALLAVLISVGIAFVLLVGFATIRVLISRRQQK